MKIITTSCEALLELIPLWKLRGCLIEEANGSKWYIDDVYKNYIDLVAERLGTKRPVPYKRLVFNVNNYVSIEIKGQRFSDLTRIIEPPMIDRLIALGNCKRILIDLQNNICMTKTPCEVKLPDLTTFDLRLCLAWHNTSSCNVINFKKVSELNQFMKPYDANRLASARHAEIASAIYYTELGMTVVDVSIQQLDKANSRWKDFDLLVNGKPIDVKNSRRSFSSPKSYSQHTVPRFKQERNTRDEVALSGVLSGYVSYNADEAFIKQTKCLILGEVKLSEIKKLLAWVNRRFKSILDINSLLNTKFMPGWIFEFPDEHYILRTQSIISISEVISRCFQITGNYLNIPKWIISLSDDANLPLNAKFNEYQKSVWLDLKSIRNDVGLSRATIYCYVLGYFLESILTHKPIENVELTLVEAIFPPWSEFKFTRPLGLEDPLEYISNLIKMLAIIYEEIIKQRLSFMSFKLTHPQILLGMKADGSWLTLYAYCGGWRLSPTLVKCGETPLYIGKHSHCKKCGHLICDKCKSCSNDCVSYSNRIRDALNDELINNYYNNKN